MPAPALVIPAAPLITEVMLISGTAVPLAIVKVRVAAFKAIGALMMEVVALALVVTLPASVKVPVPVIEVPVIFTAPTLETLKVLNANVPLLTVSVPAIEVSVTPRVVVPTLIVRLLNDVKIVAGNVLVAFNTTVPVLCVQVPEPAPTAKLPVVSVLPAVMVMVPVAGVTPVPPNIKLPAVSDDVLKNVIVPAQAALPQPPTCTNPLTVRALPETVKLSVPAPEPPPAPKLPICKLAQAATAVLTVTV